MIDLIESHNNSDKIALQDGDKQLPYKEINKLCELYRKSISSKTLMLIIGDNSTEPIIFYLACLKNDTIPLILNETISTHYIEQYIKALKPSALLTKKNLRYSYLKYVQNFGQYRLYNLKGLKFLSKEIPAILLTTSGSTGNPKLVKVTKENLISNTQSICEYLKIDNSSKQITTLPFSYTYGLSCINTHLYKGGKIILNNDSIISKNFWKLVKNTTPNTMAGVPYTYEMLFKLGLNNENLHSIKQFTQAGGKLSKKFISEYLKFCKFNNKEFIVMYGQTEATARMSYLPFKDLENKNGSIGKPIPRGKFSIINKEKYNKINGYEVGELVYYGPNVFQGYALSADDIKIDSQRIKKLETGDLAYKDDNDFYYICGRKNRFAKISGIRISLDDIEEISRSISESGAVSDDKFLFIYFKNSSVIENLGQKIKNLVKEKVNISQTLIKTIAVDNLPRSDSGKILYNKLLK